MPAPARRLAAAAVAALLAAPALAQSAPAQSAPPPGPFFARFDADGDGRITRAEMTAARTRQFERADRNGDGQISADELAAIQARLARAQDALAGAAARLDRDGSGSLDLAEFTAEAPLFALLDIDGDGALSAAEAGRARAILQN